MRAIGKIKKHKDVVAMDCSSANPAIGLSFVIGRQWTSYLPFGLASIRTAASKTGELTLPTLMRRSRQAAFGQRNLALAEAARISTWPCSHLQVVSRFCSLAGDRGPQIASANFDGRQHWFSTLKPNLSADDAP